MLLPIRTEMSVRRTPLVNLGLLVVDVLLFLLFDVAPTPALTAFKASHFVLDGGDLKPYQLITYQFAHADAWHLVGNMLFLWVFGNAVNAKLGGVTYALFYLAGGTFAGLVFAWLSPASLLGASGSIAAVTTAYLVLFPRSRVTVLYIFFIVGFIEVPATIIIGLKIILWDNILAPQIAGGAGQVAYSAHLAGYLFGLIIVTTLLLLKLVPRDQFDMLALLKRWNQRRRYAAAMANPEARPQAELGRVARVEPANRVEREKWARQLDERMELRSRIAAHLRCREMSEALRGYENLISADPDQCLPAEQQMSVAREYYATSRYPQAAAAFERYLAHYENAAEASEVRLLLGIIHARDLKQYETAEHHLQSALSQNLSDTRRQQAERWLAKVHGMLGKAGEG